MKKIALLFFLSVILLNSQKSYSQGILDTLQGFIRPDVGSYCMCGITFEIDSNYRINPENRYTELVKGFFDFDFVLYSNYHVEIIGYWDVCVEGCPVFRVHSIQIVVQGFVKNIPTICMCGTVFELDIQYRPTPDFEFMILIGDYSPYENYHLEVRGDPGVCAGPCIGMNVDALLILPTSVNENSISAFPEYNLLQNYPNPFNPATIIKFDIPTEGLVSLKIYDILGREVTTLVNEVKQVGSYEVTWNASGLPSGVYFYRLEAKNFVTSKKLLMLR